MLDLLCRREMPPAGRQVGDTRHVGESDDRAVVETDALLARSLEWGPCHRAGDVAVRAVAASRHRRVVGWRATIRQHVSGDAFAPISRPSGRRDLMGEFDPKRSFRRHRSWLTLTRDALKDLNDSWSISVIGFGKRDPLIELTQA
jgi:hypothetical protein